MIRIFIGALFLVTAPYKVYSQKNNTEIPGSNLSVRFNILGLADPVDENLSFGIEHRCRSNWSVGTDVGWVFNTGYIRNSKSAKGIIGRPFLRYYPENRNSFWEAELHYKYVSYKIEDWLGRIPVNNIPAYEEFTNFNLQKHAAGIHIKWGIQSNISRNHKFKFEFVSGLGIRFKWHKVLDGIYTINRRINNITNETYIGPVIPVNLRLVYVIK
ncbi:MAG: DUF3575 domain-containing protein [Chitinophagaceae bacterium]